MKTISLRSPETLPRSDLGGKAKNLCVLSHAGLPVPDGWVIPISEFTAHLDRCRLDGQVGLGSDIPNSDTLAGIRQLIQSEDLDPQLALALAELPPGPLSVRSSASVEDLAAASYSGLFETVLGVNGAKALADAVRHVWASVFTHQVQTYHRRVNPAGEFPKMAVLIMPMVAADAAGVAFSANPADGNPFQIPISACRGLGTTVVQASEQCDRYVLDLDSLSVLEATPGSQLRGEFLGPDGTVRPRPVESSAKGRPVLSEQDLMRLGEIVRRIDDELDTRVDVEFAIADGRIAVLQARPLVGLPPYFPDNPADPAYCSSDSSATLLSPFTEADYLANPVRPTSPPAPWPMEVEEFIVRHGRLFDRLPDHPEWEQSPDSSGGSDRTFVARMLALEEPGDDLRAARDWTKAVYSTTIPTLRQQAEAILRRSPQELARSTQCELLRLLEEALTTAHACSNLYLSASGGTWETLRRIEILARDWITNSDFEASSAIANAAIQGAPKLTHERDAELEAVAAGKMAEEEYASRWGYGYLAIEDMTDIAKWRSWREDPTPVRVAADLLRRQRVAVPFAARLKRAVEQSNRTFEDALTRLATDGHPQAAQRRRVFVACVEAGRLVFPLKDDRDLTFAHGQSALRWVLMEMGRRLVAEGVSDCADDVFLLASDELTAWLQGGSCEVGQLRALLADKRRQQRRMARYRLTTLADTQQPQAAAVGSVLRAFPGSPGVGQGPARVVASVSDAQHLQPGDILCLLGERRVGWTMFFPIIAGLAYEDGNWLCHEVNICRELGIPAVVCVGSQLRAVRNGERLHLDGARGTITRVELST